MNGIVAVDLGFGRVKALSTERQLEFPSVLGPWRDIRYKVDLSNNDFLDHLAVEYCGQRFFLGNMAYKQSTAKMNMSMNRFYSCEGMVFMLTAIAVLFEPVRSITCSVMTGLPVNAYALQKDSFAKALMGQHYIKLLKASAEDRYITITQCKILPQPVGTLFNLVLNDDGRLANKDLALARVGILDIGANTVDLCRVDSLQFVDRESTSFSDLGVYECNRQLSFEVYNSFGIEIPTEEIEPYVVNSAIKIGGQFHSIADLKNRVYRDAAEKIVSRAKNVWRNLWQLDRVFITGGGAEAFGDHIARIFNNPQQVEVCKNGGFSNAFGYMKYAKRSWAK